MRDSLRKRIEFLGLVLNSKRKYSLTEMTEIFDCEELTIKRYMQYFRAEGIDIHSSKRKGIFIESKIEEVEIRRLVAEYAGLAIFSKSYDKATGMLVAQHGINALTIITILQQCIDNNHMVEIIYDKPESSEHSSRMLKPFLLFERDSYWRLYAEEDGTYKQFLLNRIQSVKESKRIFDPIDLDKVFTLLNTSMKSWIGNKSYKIKLQIDEPWSSRVKSKQLMENQTITELKDGLIILEATVNSLNEIAGWILSRGKGIEVVEPQKLKDKVLQLAYEVINNHNY